ncbi:MAG: peptidoglycan-associated lipoprotein Pal [Candidatus Symbiobacter sp.]|nr:peptidoglycan-associated lipoprotein Pal [Candidatus Symbiobacter sp.]
MSKYVIILALTPILAGCSNSGQKSADNAASGMASPAASAASPMAPSAVNPDMETGKTDTAPTPEPLAVKNGGLKGCATDQITSYDQYKAEIGDRVFFAYDKSDLTKAARDVLDCQAVWLAANKSTTVRIEGHCDERGTREYNIALGERRANAVKNYLVAKGVEGNRLNTISYGKERPAAVGSDEEAWRQNRRGVTVPEGIQ